jgi:basic membrane protein A and related proteins
LKRVLIVLAILAVADVALLFVGGGEAEVVPEDAVRVGLVFDVGGRGDKSFNDSAFAGLMRAKDELGIAAEYIEPADGADRESAMRIFASRGFDLIVGTGFIFTDDVTLLAEEYPDLRFACVDYALKSDEDGNPLPPPPNVAALKFREEEGSFLVGALSGLLSESGKVGFIGGMPVPLIQRFEAGYRAGVGHVCEGCGVSVNYAGVTHTAFKDPGKGKELALAQYRGGADIVYHASGSTGLGVFEAARLTENLAIGVDSDQYHEAPGYILTSMIKRVDHVLFTVIEEVTRDEFRGGVHSFGLSEGGVGFVDDENNREMIPGEARARVNDIRDQIIAGEIHVPTTP